MTNEELLREFDDKWDTDELGYDDYGCDGMSEECCGSCGGWKASHDKFKNFIRLSLHQAELNWLTEQIERVGKHKESYETIGELYRGYETCRLEIITPLIERKKEVEDIIRNQEGRK